jgi:hypothetical protein
VNCGWGAGECCFVRAVEKDGGWEGCVVGVGVRVPSGSGILTMPQNGIRILATAMKGGARHDEVEQLKVLVRFLISVRIKNGPQVPKH